MTEPFNIPVRVYVEDTDYGGVVYHANYLKYMERARTEFLIHHGYSLPELKKSGYLFVIRDLSISYHLPAQLADLLTVTAEIEHTGNSSLVFKQNIYRDHNTLLSEGNVRVVCIKADTLRPTRIPQMLREKFI